MVPSALLVLGQASARLGTPYNRYMPDAASHTWILTASPENHEATRAHGFTVIGVKERNRPRALQIEPGERVARQPVAAATCSRRPNGFGLATP